MINVLYATNTHCVFFSIGKTDMSLVDRIKKLEDRILYLEGISPEYFNASNKPLTSFNSTVSLRTSMILTGIVCSKNLLIPISNSFLEESF